MDREKKAGLIRGRHPLPVEDYIFDEIQDMFDFEGMDEHIRRGMPAECERLVVYVTGLTAATAALIKVCTEEGKSLTLMHYDRNAGCYFPQVIFD